MKTIIKKQLPDTTILIDSAHFKKGILVFDGEDNYVGMVVSQEGELDIINVFNESISEITNKENLSKLMDEFSAYTFKQL